jgi:glycopeptide antibiotics resistance protein
VKKRFLYLGIAIILIPIGMASRTYGNQFVKLYFGDVLWAMMIYFGLKMVFPDQSKKAAYLALAFCFLIEFSQLYHAPWIDNIRSNRLGGLVLGFGFLWSDLVCYLLGIGLGYFIDETFYKRNFFSTNQVEK